METKAEESRWVQKSRKKLKKQLLTEQQMKSEKSLNYMKQANQMWINRHQSERLQLKDLPVTLFDENRHSAKTQSKFVNDLMQKLKKESVKAAPLKTFKGRIKK